MTAMSKQRSGSDRKPRAGPKGKSPKEKAPKEEKVPVLAPEQVIRERRQRLMYREEIGLFLTRLAGMALLAAVLFGVVFGVTSMKNNDMLPRISSGDLLLYYRLEKQYISQDIVVFQKDGTQYVGRIVARGGDSVEITEDSELLVNDSIVLENDIYYKTPRYTDGISYPVTLEKNQYFVLCDYREGAKDSRYFGPVSAEEMKGKVITVIRRSNL